MISSSLPYSRELCSHPYRDSHPSARRFQASFPFSQANKTAPVDGQSPHWQRCHPIDCFASSLSRIGSMRYHRNPGGDPAQHLEVLHLHAMKSWGYTMLHIVIPLSISRSRGARVITSRPRLSGMHHGPCMLTVPLCVEPVKGAGWKGGCNGLGHSQVAWALSPHSALVRNRALFPLSPLAPVSFSTCSRLWSVGRLKPEREAPGCASQSVSHSAPVALRGDNSV